MLENPYNPISQAILPATDLRPWVDFYIQYCHPVSNGKITHLPSSPTATLTLVLKGQLSLLQNNQWQPLPAVFFSGIRSSSACIQSDGDLSCLVIAFAPGNWHHLIKLPPAELKGMHIEASSLSLSWLNTLLGRLQSSPYEQHIPILEQALRNECHSKVGHQAFAQPDTAWLRDKLLHTSPGQVAKTYGLSLRQLERRFLQQFGLTPKQYQRIARTALLMARLGNTRMTSLASLALDLGFADQSHLTRDMKHFTGILPGQFKTLIEQQEDYWAFKILPDALANGSGMSRFFNP